MQTVTISLSDELLVSANMDKDEIAAAPHPSDQQSASVLDGLTGMFHDNGKDYKTQLEDALSEKYLT